MSDHPLLGLTAYPYLLMSLVLLAIAGTAVAVYSPGRRLALISAVLSAPTAGYAAFFVPEYWHPTQIVAMSPGIEDVIFSLANGATVWVIATWTIRRELVFNADLRQSIRSYLGFAVVFSLLLLVVRSFELPVMLSVVLSGVLLYAYLLFRRPELWFVSLIGGGVFVVLYSTVLATGLYFLPYFNADWNHANLLGIDLLGMPIEEPLWALFYGAIWPVLMAYVLNVSRNVTT